MCFIYIYKYELSALTPENSRKLYTTTKPLQVSDSLRIPTIAIDVAEKALTLYTPAFQLCCEALLCRLYYLYKSIGCGRGIITRTVFPSSLLLPAVFAALPQRSLTALFCFCLKILDKIFFSCCYCSA